MSLNFDIQVVLKALIQIRRISIDMDQIVFIDGNINALNWVLNVMRDNHGIKRN
jgi:hypothetical protein